MDSFVLQFRGKVIIIFGKPGRGVICFAVQEYFFFFAMQEEGNFCNLS